MQDLRLAMIHMDIRHKQADVNRSELLRLIDYAASQGARLVLAPELSISGYSFESPDDIRPFAEDCDGPTVQAMAAAGRKHGLYLAFGMAELGPGDEIYNTAIMIGPSGEVLCRYRKVTAERKWATPGSASQKNVAITPWGTIGILVCSDSYYAILPRATALRGADLLLVPANWPPIGMDPRELWQVRALENGYWVAVCNRTGKDKTMDCEHASSCVFSPDGTLLMEGRKESSDVFFTDLPLENGQLQRNGQTPPIPDDFSEWLDTPSESPPSPGPLQLIACSFQAHDESRAFIAQDIDRMHDRLVVLPAGADEDQRRVRDRARSQALAIATKINNEFVFIDPSGNLDAGSAKWPLVVDSKRARIAVASPEQMVRQEVVSALAWKNCDLIAVPAAESEVFSWDVVKTRCLEGMVVAIAATGHTCITVPPAGNERWAEMHATGSGACCTVLNTQQTRNKTVLGCVPLPKLVKDLKA